MKDVSRVEGGPFLPRHLTTRHALGEVLYLFVIGAFATLAPLAQLLTGKRSFLVWSDAREQTYAWAQKLAQAWHAGYLPLWDANTFSGHSFVGEFQTGVFYPLNWLWLTLFAGDGKFSNGALEAFILLHFFIAACGMALLLRHWRLGRFASAAGAIVFAMLGPVALRAAAQANIFYGLCWMPWALLFASRYLERARVRDALLAGAIVALQILAGHVQPAYHAVIAVGAMVFAHHWRERPDHKLAILASLRTGAIMAAALLIIASPQLILSAQYMHDAYRWVGAAAPIAPGHSVPYKIFAFKYIVTPADLPNLLDPWRWFVDDANSLYVGTVALWLIAWFLANPVRRKAIPTWCEHGPWLSVIAGLSLALMLGHYTFLPVLLRHLPVVGDVRELGRYVILWQLAASIVVACAIEALWAARASDSKLGYRRWTVVALGVLLLGYWFFDRTVLSPQALVALACAAIPIAIWHMYGFGRLAATASVAALVITAWLFAPLVVPDAEAIPSIGDAFAAAEPLTDRLAIDYGRARIAFDDSANLPKNYADVHRLQSIGGHAATMYRPYFDFLSQDWSINGPIFDLLNVRYVLSHKDLDLPLIAQDSTSGLRLYDRPTAYSRIFLMHQYGASQGERVAQFDVLEYNDEVQRFDLHADRSELAVVSEIAYPGWCAWVNGRSVPIQHAILGGKVTPLRAVPVLPGDNFIEFRYRPFSSLLIGCR